WLLVMGMPPPKKAANSQQKHHNSANDDPLFFGKALPPMIPAVLFVAVTKEQLVGRRIIAYFLIVRGGVIRGWKTASAARLVIRFLPLARFERPNNIIHAFIVA